MTPVAAERHTHTAPDGTVYEHTHEHEYAQEHGHIHEHEHSHDGNGEHEHGHAHTHTHANTKAVLNRLSRAIGHLESIRRMVEDGRDCSEVLIQLAAVRSAIQNAGKILLQDHIHHCVADALATGDQKVLDDLSRAIDQFIK